MIIAATTWKRRQFQIGPENGDLIEAVLASAALPTHSRPCVWKTRSLSGVSANVPLE